MQILNWKDTCLNDSASLNVRERLNWEVRERQHVHESSSTTCTAIQHAQAFAYVQLACNIRNLRAEIRSNSAGPYPGMAPTIATNFRPRPTVFPLRISPRNWKTFSPSSRFNEGSKTSPAWCRERSANMLKPSPFDSGIPSMPKRLDGYGRREWRRLVAHLSEKGVLCPADVFILQVTCEAYSELMRWSNVLKRSTSRCPHSRRAMRTRDADMRSALLNTYLRCLEECTAPPPDHIRLRVLSPKDPGGAGNLTAGGDR